MNLELVLFCFLFSFVPLSLGAYYYGLFILGQFLFISTGAILIYYLLWKVAS